MKTQTIVAICSLPFVLCGGCVGLAMLVNVIDPPQQTVTPEQTTKAAPVATQPIKLEATLAGFGRLQSGMTYDEVLAIVGEPTEEMSRSAIGDNEAVMYRWANGWGNMTAMFQNGLLVTKAQAGLK
jgi:hypothetical protein